MIKRNKNKVTKEKDFDLQQILNIVGQSAVNINTMSEQLGIVVSQMEKLQKEMNNINGRMVDYLLKKSA